MKGGRKKGERTREKGRRRGNNLCWLTSPYWPSGSLHLPEIIPHKNTHTQSDVRAHTLPPQIAKKKKKNWWYSNTFTQSVGARHSGFYRSLSICVSVCVSHFEDGECLCVFASVLCGCVSCLGHHMFPTNLFSPLKSPSVRMISSFN